MSEFGAHVSEIITLNDLTSDEWHAYYKPIDPN